MKAVEQGGKFGLRARMTGEVIEEVDSRPRRSARTRAFRQLGIGYANLGA
jgi:hypothetical protein